MIQLINLEDYFQQQSKTKKYIHVYINQECLPFLLFKITTIKNNPSMTELLQRYLVEEDFIVENNQYQPYIIKDNVYQCALAYINEDIGRHLFKYKYGHYQGKLILYNQKPFLTKKRQSGGRREFEDFWHIYNYQARINPLFVNFATNMGLTSLWWNRLFIYLSPLDDEIKTPILEIIKKLRSKKHPLGKMFRLFNGDWFLTRVRKVFTWFIINIFRLIPEPATQSVSNSIALNSINNELEDNIKDFSKTLRKFISGSGIPFHGFSVLEEFFEPSKGFLPIRAKKGLIEKLKPKLLKYQVAKNGESVTKEVILMPDVKHLYSYIKSGLNEFVLEDTKQFNKLIISIEKVIEKMTNLFSSLITSAVQYDSGLAGFAIQILAQKSRPDLVVMFIKQIFAIIPTNLRKLILDREQIADSISHGLRKAINILKDFPDSLEDFFKKNVPSIEPSKIKEIINNIKGLLVGKDLVTDSLEKYLVTNVEKFIDLYYLIVPLILVLSIIRGYAYQSRQLFLQNKKKSAEEKKKKDPKMGLMNIQNHTYLIWLIESKKLIESESS